MKDIFGSGNLVESSFAYNTEFGVKAKEKIPNKGLEQGIKDTKDSYKDKKKISPKSTFYNIKVNSHENNECAEEKNKETTLHIDGFQSGELSLEDLIEKDERHVAIFKEMVETIGQKKEFIDDRSKKRENKIGQDKFVRKY